MNLTLYNIETELLEVLQLRDEVASDPDMTPQETAESLKAIDQRIAEYVKAEVRKVDGIAAWISECEARAGAALAEVDRLKEKAAIWEQRSDRLRRLVIAVMREAGKTKLLGVTSELRLQKNPPSVEVSQPHLVPAEYQRIKVTMPLRVWQEVRLALLNGSIKQGWSDKSADIYTALMDSAIVGQPEPAKSKIADEMKQLCLLCNGMKNKVVVAVVGPNAMVEDGPPCEACGGSGHVGVPGCSLVTDKVHLRIV